MGNTSECGFLSDSDQQYQFLGDQNHFLYGQIKHFKSEKLQNQHFAVKKMRFQTESRLKEFRDFISIYQQICGTLHLTKAFEYLNSNKTTKQQNQGGKQNIDDKQNSKPLFNCNKNNFIFTSVTEQLSCSDASFFLAINLEYLQQKHRLQSLINEKSFKLQKSLQNNKVNQNILLQLQNKVKLCEYEKIDRLPQKERSMINLFFNEIQVLRMLDYMLTALYGLKINGIKVDAVRPELFFKSQNCEKLSYFYPDVINRKDMDNFQKSYDSLRKWLNQQNAKFHHNWTLKQRQLVSYIHPDNLQKLTDMLIHENDENFNMVNSLSRSQIQKQNIFSLGLIILQICLLQPQISSKLYSVSICKQQKQVNQTKKEMRYSFQRQNLTIKFNNSVLQKYLFQMKTRYSQKFVQLVELMLFETTLNQTQMSNKTSVHNLTYEDVIQYLSTLTEENVQNLKSVYNCSNKSKSKSKNQSKQNSRKPSLSRQVSLSGVSNPSLSSSSSLSMFPVQTRQKLLSIELLRKNCKKLQNKLQKVLIQSQLQTLTGSFAKRQEKLEELISKDEERILSQLNKLNNKTVSQKQARFSYRKAEPNYQINLNKGHQSFSSTINFSIGQNEEYGNFKLNVPQSFSIKNQSQSQDKQKRMNSTTKIKKTILQKARQQQSMGNSICHTIILNKSRNISQEEESNYSMNNDNLFKKIDPNSTTNGQRNTQSNDKVVSSFLQGQMEPFSSKSQLKNLIAIKNKNSTMNKEHPNIHLSSEDKTLKQLKSKQLYEIYMKEYKNLINSQKSISS